MANERDEGVGVASWPQVVAAFADLGLEWTVEDPTEGELSFFFDDGVLWLRGRLGTVVDLPTQLARRAGRPLVRFVSEIEPSGDRQLEVTKVASTGAPFSIESLSGASWEEAEVVADQHFGEHRLPIELLVLPDFGVRYGVVRRPARPTRVADVEPLPWPEPRFSVREESGGDRAVISSDGRDVVEAEVGSDEEGVAIECRRLVSAGELCDRHIAGLVCRLWARERFAGQAITASGPRPRGSTADRLDVELGVSSGPRPRGSTVRVRP